MQQVCSFVAESNPQITARYLLHLPQGYDPAGPRWPLIFFLHGAAERGSNLRVVKRHGPPKFLDRRPEFPFIVVSPQCPTDTRWSLEVLEPLLADVITRYAVDPDRVYGTGLSMGGFGTWGLAIADPTRFAAIAPVCGGGAPALVCAIRHLPVWAFHGAKDEVVPLQRSVEMVEALKACGGDVRFTVYPEAKHDSWTATYANPELYSWFLAHRRTGVGGEGSGVAHAS
jgi:predicted peptidase